MRLDFKKGESTGLHSWRPNEEGEHTELDLDADGLHIYSYNTIGYLDLSQYYKNGSPFTLDFTIEDKSGISTDKDVIYLVFGRHIYGNYNDSIIVGRRSGTTYPVIGKVSNNSIEFSDISLFGNDVNEDYANSPLDMVSGGEHLLRLVYYPIQYGKQTVRLYHNDMIICDAHGFTSTNFNFKNNELYFGTSTTSTINGYNIRVDVANVTFGMIEFEKDKMIVPDPVTGVLIKTVDDTNYLPLSGERILYGNNGDSVVVYFTTPFIIRPEMIEVYFNDASRNKVGTHLHYVSGNGTTEAPYQFKGVISVDVPEGVLNYSVEYLGNVIRQTNPNYSVSRTPPSDIVVHVVGNTAHTIILDLEQITDNLFIDLDRDLSNYIVTAKAFTSDGIERSSITWENVRGPNVTTDTRRYISNLEPHTTYTVRCDATDPVRNSTFGVLTRDIGFLPKSGLPFIRTEDDVAPLLSGMTSSDPPSGNPRILLDFNAHDTGSFYHVWCIALTSAIDSNSPEFVAFVKQYGNFVAENEPGTEVPVNYTTELLHSFADINTTTPVEILTGIQYHVYYMVVDEQFDASGNAPMVDVSGNPLPENVTVYTDTHFIMPEIRNLTFECSTERDFLNVNDFVTLTWETEYNVTYVEQFTVDILDYTDVEVTGVFPGTGPFTSTVYVTALNPSEDKYANFRLYHNTVTKTELTQSIRRFVDRRVPNFTYTVDINEVTETTSLLKLASFTDEYFSNYTDAIGYYMKLTAEPDPSGNYPTGNVIVHEYYDSDVILFTEQLFENMSSYADYKIIADYNDPAGNTVSRRVLTTFRTKDDTVPEILDYNIVTVNNNGNLEINSTGLTYDSFTHTDVYLAAFATPFNVTSANNANLLEFFVNHSCGTKVLDSAMFDQNNSFDSSIDNKDLKVFYTSITDFSAGQDLSVGIDYMVLVCVIDRRPNITISTLPIYELPVISSISIHSNNANGSTKVAKEGDIIRATWTTPFYEEIGDFTVYVPSDGSYMEVKQGVDNFEFYAEYTVTSSSQQGDFEFHILYTTKPLNDIWDTDTAVYIDTELPVVNITITDITKSSISFTYIATDNYNTDKNENLIHLQTLSFEAIVANTTNNPNGNEVIFIADKDDIFVPNKTVTISGLSEFTEYNIEITFKDAAGNVLEETLPTFRTLDKTPPVTNSISLEHINDELDLKFRIHGEANDSFTPFDMYFLVFSQGTPLSDEILDNFTDTYGQTPEVKIYTSVTPWDTYYAETAREYDTDLKDKNLAVVHNIINNGTTSDIEVDVDYKVVVFLKDEQDNVSHTLISTKVTPVVTSIGVYNTSALYDTRTAKLSDVIRITWNSEYSDEPASFWVNVDSPGHNLNIMPSSIVQTGPNVYYIDYTIDVATTEGPIDFTVHYKSRSYTVLDDEALRLYVDKTPPNIVVTISTETGVTRDSLLCNIFFSDAYNGDNTVTDNYKITISAIPDPVGSFPGGIVQSEVINDSFCFTTTQVLFSGLSEYTDYNIWCELVDPAQNSRKQIETSQQTLDKTDPIITAMNITNVSDAANNSLTIGVYGTAYDSYTNFDVYMAVFVDNTEFDTTGKTPEQIVTQENDLRSFFVVNAHGNLVADDLTNSNRVQENVSTRISYNSTNANPNKDAKFAYQSVSDPTNVPIEVLHKYYVLVFVIDAQDNMYYTYPEYVPNPLLTSVYQESKNITNGVVNNKIAREGDTVRLTWVSAYSALPEEFTVVIDEPEMNYSTTNGDLTVVNTGDNVTFYTEFVVPANGLITNGGLAFKISLTGSDGYLDFITLIGGDVQPVYIDTVVPVVTCTIENASIIKNSVNINYTFTDTYLSSRGASNYKLTIKAIPVSSGNEKTIVRNNADVNGTNDVTISGLSEWTEYRIVLDYNDPAGNTGTIVAELDDYPQGTTVFRTQDQSNPEIRSLTPTTIPASTAARDLQVQINMTVFDAFTNMNVYVALFANDVTGTNAQFRTFFVTEERGTVVEMGTSPGSEAAIAVTHANGALTGVYNSLTTDTVVDVAVGTQYKVICYVEDTNPNNGYNVYEYNNAVLSTPYIRPAALNSFTASTMNSSTNKVAKEGETIRLRWEPEFNEETSDFTMVVNGQTLTVYKDVNGFYADYTVGAGSPNGDITISLTYAGTVFTDLILDAKVYVDTVPPTISSVGTRLLTSSSFFVTYNISDNYYSAKSDPVGYSMTISAVPIGEGNGSTQNRTGSTVSTTITNSDVFTRGGNGVMLSGLLEYFRYKVEILVKDKVGNSTQSVYISSITTNDDTTPVFENIAVTHATTYGNLTWNVSTKVRDTFSQYTVYIAAFKTNTFITDINTIASFFSGKTAVGTYEANASASTVYVNGLSTVYNSLIDSGTSQFYPNTNYYFVAYAIDSYGKMKSINTVTSREGVVTTRTLSVNNGTVTTGKDGDVVTLNWTTTYNETIDKFAVLWDEDTDGSATKSSWNVRMFSSTFTINGNTVDNRNLPWQITYNGTVYNLTTSGQSWIYVDRSAPFLSFELTDDPDGPNTATIKYSVKSMSDNFAISKGNTGGYSISAILKNSGGTQINSNSHANVTCYQDGSAPGISGSFIGLSEKTLYSVYLTVTDPAGNSAQYTASNGVHITTADETPVEVRAAPSIVEFDTATATLRVHYNEACTVYYLASTTAHSSTYSEITSTLNYTSAGSAQDFVISSLDPGTTYYISVYAKDNNNNNTSITNISTFSTLSGKIHTGNYEYSPPGTANNMTYYFGRISNINTLDYLATGHVVTTWSAKTTGGSNYNVYVQVSTQSGAPLLSSEFQANTDANDHMLPCVACSGNTIMVAWLFRSPNAGSWAAAIYWRIGTWNGSNTVTWNGILSRSTDTLRNINRLSLAGLKVGSGFVMTYINQYQEAIYQQVQEICSCDRFGCYYCNRDYLSHTNYRNQLYRITLNTSGGVTAADIPHQHILKDNDDMYYMVEPSVFDIGTHYVITWKDGTTSIYALVYDLHHSYVSGRTSIATVSGTSLSMPSVFKSFTENNYIITYQENVLDGGGNSTIYAKEYNIHSPSRTTSVVHTGTITTVPGDTYAPCYCMQYAGNYHFMTPYTSGGVVYYKQNIRTASFGVVSDSDETLGAGDPILWSAGVPIQFLSLGANSYILNKVTSASSSAPYAIQVSNVLKT